MGLFDALRSVASLGVGCSSIIVMTAVESACIATNASVKSCVVPLVKPERAEPIVPIYKKGSPCSWRACAVGADCSLNAGVFNAQDLCVSPGTACIIRMKNGSDGPRGVFSVAGDCVKEGTPCLRSLGDIKLVDGKPHYSPLPGVFLANGTCGEDPNKKTKRSSTTLFLLLFLGETDRGGSGSRGAAGESGCG